MEEILQLQVLDNSVQLYLEVFGVIILALIIKRILSKYLAALLYRVFTKAGKSFHKKAFLELIVEPLDAFIVTLVVIIAFDKLKFPEILKLDIYKTSAKNILDGIANAAIVITFIRLCIRFVKFFALILEEKANITANQSDNQLVIFFRDFFRVILYILGILLILRFTFSYDISKLVTGLSIVGAAIALATKESLENLIASFIIFFDKPFTTGDLVKVQGFTGNVEKIGLRSTRIRTDHKTYITVPNKQMVDTILDNISLRSERRVLLTLEVDLNAGIQQLRDIIDAIKNLVQHNDVNSSTVLLGDTGKNAHIITVEYFTTMQQDLAAFNDLRESINFSVIELLRSHHVELAAATTDIIIQQKKPE